MGNIITIKHGSSDPKTLNPYELGYDESGNGTLYIGNKNSVAIKIGGAGGFLPLGGGHMSGEIKTGQDDGYGIQLGTNGRINATTSSGSTTATVCGISGNNCLLGHSSFASTLRGSGTRPTYNGKELALKSDIVADTNTTYTFATGSSNGTFSVTPSNGSAQSIAIKGLGSAAYTASTAYAEASHGHDYASSSHTHTPTVKTTPSLTTVTAKTVSRQTVTSLASLSLTAGTWVIIGHAYTNSSVGLIQCDINTSTSFTDFRTQVSLQSPYANTGIENVRIVSPSSTTTYYFVGYYGGAVVVEDGHYTNSDNTSPATCTFDINFSAVKIG